ncbi:SIS domain-containing protein [Bosea caraganae]|uniref:Glutamine--fructose-6-phosphate aminotransferase [isomerizing] n=1 Tax=Bosea caraganae TaxID=2763117 RepID=A0A370LCS2_9HYPH|nr:SIS domain-containing protein [Bosea caraganae]RDJ27760.1 SIS domain-containing protein [Bosea caraganae]RDJ29773.1 SIS domain-containing protein [Bosea caraganae]
MVDHSQEFKKLKRESSSDAPGDPERFRRVELTNLEMMAQGQAISRTLETTAETVARIAAEMKDRPLRRIVMIGCGDSWISGHGVRLAVERILGVICEPYEAFDFEHYGLATVDEATLVIGLSSSGNTAPVTAGLKGALAKGAYVVALTNTATAPMMRDFPNALLIQATRGGWPTQSSTAAMALKIALALAIAKARGRGEGEAPGLTADLAALPALMDRVSTGFYERAAALGKELARAELVLLTGAGPHFAPAAFGAAKLKELAPIHAIAFPLEEYHHYRTQKAGDPMFLIAPDAASHQRALETAIVSKGVGGRTIALVPEGETAISAEVAHAWHLPAVRVELAPLVYSVPLHLFSYHVTKARDALGLGAPQLGGLAA